MPLGKLVQLLWAGLLVKNLKPANDPSIKPLSVPEGSEVGELRRQLCTVFIMPFSTIARMGIRIAVQQLINRYGKHTISTL